MSRAAVDPPLTPSETTPLIPSETTTRPSLPHTDRSVLEKWEVFWRDHQKWLEEKGYMLRPRYRVDWVPTWKGQPVATFDHEDAAALTHGHIIDATKISTNELVTLKRISKTDHPTEIPITRYFSSEPQASKPQNHCIPLYDVLDVPDNPDQAILVLPMLRPFDDPPMETVGEAMEFFRQVFEGMQFVHKSNVAHRDCMELNIMMDPSNMYPDMFHPRFPDFTREWKGRAKYYSRTARPTKYYIIDFGLSTKFNPEDGPALVYPIEGGDKTVPEFQNRSGWRNRDPFPTDIYYIGNVIREGFLEQMHGLEFMEPLIDDMVQDDPEKRPTIDEVVEEFGKILSSQSWWSLSSRLTRKEDNTGGVSASVRHFLQVLGNSLLFRSPLPTPK